MDAGVFVLGMHRSGTSAATRLVNLLGVPTAREDDLVQPTADNPTGFWESASLVSFNTRVLGAVGSETGCPLRLEPGWERDSRLDGLRTEAGAVFAAALPGAPWVWKDPRNCLTFAFWRSVLDDVRPVVVLVGRNPSEIAASLHARDGEGAIYAFALWERYLRQALSSIEGLPVLVTRYDELLDAPLDWCSRTRVFLADAGVDSVDPQAEDVHSFVDRGLRHASFTTEDFMADGSTSEAQRALFAALAKVAGAHERFVVPALPAETPTTEALVAERRRTVEVRRELRRLQANDPSPSRGSAARRLMALARAAL